ncbi:MAG: ECF-type sigma factor [Candidatus Krumholzibacteria bacterium]|nr:ECF-type sigma factor [Candidatus Krumholzibacteria bacterium]MDH4337011.1 ECF-type sigma factor [Candidatus Krumholzibacteria bacterium]MDH5268548.1 ECF-type sigma factor [Candidatus Krumholzibacteria bacterium]
MNRERAERILRETSAGGSGSVEEAVAMVYDQLRAVAAGYLRRERAGHSLQPTELVHEAFVRLAQQSGLNWENRIHFIHIAAAQIRRVLVDHARRRNRNKRGGDLVRVTLSDVTDGTQPSFDLMALNDALERLDAQSTEDRQIVELKYFGGLTEAEIASLLGISERTVRRRWSFARTWLFKELTE